MPIGPCDRGESVPPPGDRNGFPRSHGPSEQIVNRQSLRLRSHPDNPSSRLISPQPDAPVRGRASQPGRLYPQIVDCGSTQKAILSLAVLLEKKGRGPATPAVRGRRLIGASAMSCPSSKDRTRRTPGVFRADPDHQLVLADRVAEFSDAASGRGDRAPSPRLPAKAPGHPGWKGTVCPPGLVRGSP
jgi:hypothetical protein